MIIKILEELTRFLWGFPMIILLLGTHVYFTFRTGFVQKWVFKGIRMSFSPSRKTTDGITPFQALAASLAATIGTGNIIGISTAIAIGGPGAVFWCWITGILGIATCYGECLLSALYRVKNSAGKYLGGPMYVLKYTLHKPLLGALFAGAAVLASFGMGSSVQSHSISTAIREHFPVSPHIIGMVAALLAGFVLLGGVGAISRLCSYFVPFMSAFYLAGCAILLILNRSFLGDAIVLIFRSAFSSRSFVGGIAGTAVMLGLRTGVSRGLFTNEAGLGSIPMSAATAQSEDPVSLSLIAMTGPFWDTVVICAITGLAIVSSILSDPAGFAAIPGEALCFAAFDKLPFLGKEMLSLSLVLFAFATILGWSYYGECSARFLAGERGVKVYQVLYLLSIYLGAVISLELVWGISDLLNALMALPNLLCLWMLRDKVSFYCPKGRPRQR